jgi:predicted acylesterase/phospholipase RssA
MEELRIGLVLYGGVALAVYINGVVTEIWQAQRASRAMQDGEDTNLDSTSGIYRDLLADLKASSDADELRIVVDAVTGTSAGGVNGAAMFKAIVEGADASVLNDVWLNNNADIKNLQGDPGSMPWYLRAAENLLRIFPTLKNARKGLREQTTLELDLDTRHRLHARDNERFTKIAAGRRLLDDDHCSVAAPDVGEQAERVAARSIRF